ncbi:MAG TPA: TonB-dependent receptor [Ohtaekwangia sp.]
MKNWITIVFLFTAQVIWAQADSVKTEELKAVTIQSTRLDVDRLPSSQGTYMLGGKKNEVLNVQDMNVNIAEKTPRQIFSKVPGVFVYDMDGTGNQTNISTRGLDPHRGWEYNIRKNGIITNSDMYAYPASHYSMPMEAVERIELIRGTGSLQYGAQFGGMLNYVSKRPDTTRAIVFESINAAGSFGLLSTYNAISGTIGKFQYYAYYHKRVSDGYRENGDTDFDAQSAVLIYNVNDHIRIKAELARSNYIYHIPGQMTDSMFYADPQQSTRSRNYFNPEIYVPSLSLDWKLGERTHLSWIVSAVLGNRNSVMFDKVATVSDVINPVTNEYAPRQVDIDNFNSYTTELRLLHHYTLGKVQGTAVGGIQIFDNNLHRQQMGVGTTGTDFDLTITDAGFGRDLHMKTNNFAFFAENAFRLTPHLTVTPGMRMEIGNSDLSGKTSYYDPEELPNTIKHNFPLFGFSAEYLTAAGNSFYGGWSQAYRPVLFKDIIPANTYEVIDKNLKDARGYNLEVGYRGTVKYFRWDVSLFSLKYDNRLGTLEESDPVTNETYFYRTNIGDSRTDGAEIFAEYTIPVQDRASISLFTSTAFFHGRYTSGEVRSGNNAGGSAEAENIDISGNKLESVPDVITRNGVTFRYDRVSMSVLYSYTAESYADALNTEKPSKTGGVGLVPTYAILDMNASIRVSNQLMIRASFNNVTNKQYFTKRPTMYPGPGVWSSDGRSLNCSIAIKV